MRSCIVVACVLALLLVVACDGPDGGVQTHNSPPAATITLPPDDTEPYTVGEPITFEGTALDQGGAPGERSGTCTSNHDGVLDEESPDADGIVTFTTNELTPQTHIITLQIVDMGGLSDEDTVTVIVVPESDRDDDGDGYTPNEGDCDDTDPEVHPGHEEEPNGTDDDCDGDVDEGTALYDDDGDGWTEQDGDCDDGEENTYPDAPELGDGLDNDCDGQVDEGTVLFDDDGDGYTESEGDCDDADPAAYPNATEAPDGIDNDCDGVIDEGTVAYDDDGDGYSENDGDCDDSDADVNPGEIEECDGLDNDCNGTVDDEGAEGCVNYFYDYDGDTYGVEDPPSQCLCGPTAEYTALQAGDCYDFNYDAKPGQTNWFAVQRGDASFDYDCNGSEERYDETLADYACPGIDANFCDMVQDGWQGSVPDCGQTGTWITSCTFWVYGDCGWFCCTFGETLDQQTCR